MSYKSRLRERVRKAVEVMESLHKLAEELKKEEIEKKKRRRFY